MIRLPYRQIYGPEQDVEFGSLFTATLSMVDIRTWPDYRPVIALPHPQMTPGHAASPGGVR
jgi:hypothetical protein